MDSVDHKYMGLALKQAQLGADKDEVPVGAVVVCNGEIVAETHNFKEQKQLATGHAEIAALNEASMKLGRWRLTDCTMYVTLEPCSMCAGAIVQARLGKLVIGAMDPKAGACGSVLDITHHEKLNHKVEVVSGVLEAECSQILKGFFKAKR